MELIKRYPSDTLFFMHSWTWIEDILKSISWAFQCPVRSFTNHLLQSLADLGVKLEVSPKNLPPLHAPLRSICCPKHLGTRLELSPIWQIVDDWCSQGWMTWLIIMFYLLSPWPGSQSNVHSQVLTRNSRCPKKESPMNVKPFPSIIPSRCACSP